MYLPMAMYFRSPSWKVKARRSDGELHAVPCHQRDHDAGDQPARLACQARRASNQCDAGQDQQRRERRKEEP